VRELDAAGIPVRDVGIRRSTLDDVFFALTGRPSEDGDGDGAGARKARNENVEKVRS